MRRRLAVLGLLLAPAVALHVMRAPRRGPFDRDPSYYLQVARHVAAGDGLVTSVSQYLAGLDPLPQPYTDYPAWPLLLGGMAWATGVIAAANIAPQLLYLIDLVLLYFVALRLDRRSGAAAGAEWDAAHLVTLLFALNFIFFTSTTVPYTEGLAFALALGSYLLIDRHPFWSGALAGLSVMARYQMAPIVAATALVVALARRFRDATAYAAASVLVALPWLLWLAVAPVHHVAIPGWQEWLPSPTLVDRVVHVAKGLVVAANPVTDRSLFHAFGAAVLAVPLAIYWSRRRRDVLFWSLVASGIASVVVLANFESVRAPFWLFGSRHSLPFVFLLIPALVVTLTEAPRIVRVVALLLGCVSIVQGAVALMQTPMPNGTGIVGAEKATMDWLDRHAPHATVLTTNAQVLSIYGGQRFHWTDCSVAPATTRAMLARLPIDYVVVYDSERPCAFVRGVDLATEATFADPFHTVYLMRNMRRVGVNAERPAFSRPAVPPQTTSAPSDRSSEN